MKSKTSILSMALGLVVMLAVVGTRGATTSASRVDTSVQVPAGISLAANSTAPLTPVGNGFTYQGSLKSGGSPANGQYDFQFTLFDALAGGSLAAGPVTTANVTVASGLFTVPLDFGASAITGEARYLEIAVRQTGGGTFTTLSPRQSLTPAPYALSLKPGAVISGTTGGTTLTANYPGYGVGVQGTTVGGAGVKGSSSASGAGVYGESVSGYGVVGVSSSSWGVYGTSVGSVGVFGYSTNFEGVHGETRSNFPGVYGHNTYTNTGGIGPGVRGDSESGSGVYGYSANGYGVDGLSAAENGVGVEGIANTGSLAAGLVGSSTNGRGVYAASTYGYGVYGVSSYSYGVYGTSSTNDAIYGYANNGRGVVGSSVNNDGVQGTSNSLSGVAGFSTNGYGVYGYSTSGPYAGYFQGNVRVTGTCCFMGAGTIQIDDPLDPANRYLNQSTVQSPDMKSIYDGVATLDTIGEAWVAMPSYSQSLNQDFRYQLTPIGAPGRDLYIAQEIQNNRFKIAGGQAGMKVSWQVTGIRKDPYAKQHPVPVEQDKPANEKGKYLHPAEYGQPESMGLGYEQSQRAKQQLTPLPVKQGR